MKHCQKSICCKVALDQDYLVCTCMGVMKSEIIVAINNNDANSLKLLSDQLGVATGCLSCVEEILQILDQANKKCCQKKEAY